MSAPSRLILCPTKGTKQKWAKSRTFVVISTRLQPRRQPRGGATRVTRDAVVCRKQRTRVGSASKQRHITRFSSGSYPRNHLEAQPDSPLPVVGAGAESELMVAQRDNEKILQTGAREDINVYVVQQTTPTNTMFKMLCKPILYCYISYSVYEALFIELVIFQST